MGKFIKAFVFVILLLVSAVFVNTSYAVSEETASDVPTVTKIRENVVKEEVMMKKEAKMAEKESAMVTKAAMKEARLSEARLKICQAKEVAIENRFKALLALGEKTHMGRDKIIDRVDNFYTTVLVPKGFVLENYDALKADIDAKEANVKAALANAQQYGQEFSCDSEDPKGQSDAFKQYIQQLVTANKEYRTSVRTFVVAVRDLANQSKTDKLSPGPEAMQKVSPTVAPVVTSVPVQ